MVVQVEVLQDCMQAAVQHLASQRLAVEQDCRAARAALQEATSRLQLELGSAGNIWLEEGRSSKAWVQSCQELLCNSCVPQPTPPGSSAQREHVQVSILTAGSSQTLQDACAAAPAELLTLACLTAPTSFLLPQVVAATRIHNRHLRAQFGKHWQPGAAFEYLFFTGQAGAHSATGSAATLCRRLLLYVSCILTANQLPCRRYHASSNPFAFTVLLVPQRTCCTSPSMASSR